MVGHYAKMAALVIQCTKAMATSVCAPAVSTDETAKIKVNCFCTCRSFVTILTVYLFLISITQLLD